MHCCGFSPLCICTTLNAEGKGGHGEADAHRIWDSRAGFWTRRHHSYGTHLPLLPTLPSAGVSGLQTHLPPNNPLWGGKREVAQREAETWMLLGAPVRVSATCHQVWPREQIEASGSSGIRRSGPGLQKMDR